MRVLHDMIGPIDLDCQVLLAPEGDHCIVLHTPPPGSDTAEHLALLHVIGPEQFSTVGLDES